MSRHISSARLNRYILSAAFVGFLVGIVAVRTDGQCQDQFCTTRRGCFICSENTSLFCSVSCFPGGCCKQCTTGFCKAAEPATTALIPVSSPTLPTNQPASNDACLEELKRGPAPVRPFEGTGVAPAWQPESLAVIRQMSLAIDDAGDNFVLQSLVLRNMSDSPVSHYRLAWVVVSADPKKEPEVHSGEMVTLDPPIESNSEREYHENLAPPIPFDSKVKMVSVFLAEVQLKDNRVFHEDADKLAAREHGRIFALKQPK